MSQSRHGLMGKEYFDNPVFSRKSETHGANSGAVSNGYVDQLTVGNR